jgi:PAS domain S-box-containing protein
LSRFRPLQSVGTSSLPANDELFAAAFEYAPHAMAVLKADGFIVQANRSLCRLLGFTGAELCALSAGDIIHPDDAETEREQRKRLAVADIGRYDLVQRYVRKDLRIIWARVSVSAVRSSSPNAAFFVAQVEPVPPYGCPEDVLGQEVWFARIGDATLSAIHEIGNTLTPLMLNTEMLVEQSDSADVGQSAQAIFKAARRIAFALRRLRRVHDSQPVAYIGQNRMIDLRLIGPPGMERDVSASSEAGAA